MKVSNHTLQPVILTAVAHTRAAGFVNANLGNEATPFNLKLNAAVHIKSGEYNNVNLYSSKYAEMTMALTASDLDALARIENSKELGYHILLSLPLLNLEMPVSLNTLSSLVSIEDKTYYTLLVYEKPVKKPMGNWLTFWWPKKWRKAEEVNPHSRKVL